MSQVYIVDEGQVLMTMSLLTIAILPPSLVHLGNVFCVTTYPTSFVSLFHIVEPAIIEAYQSFKYLVLLWYLNA